MSMIIWNIRGLGSRNSWNYHKYIIVLHHPIVVSILEPKQQASKIGEFAHKLGFSGFCNGNATNTHIWLFWKLMANVQVIEVTSQTLSIQLTLPGLPDILLSMVYAKCTRAERVQLWTDLSHHNSSNLPWLVGGDFNTILSLSEKKCGLNPDTRSL